MKRRDVVVLGMTGLALAGCGFGGPAPKSYVLGAPAPAVDMATPLAGRPAIVVQRVLLPDYLDVTDLLIRRPGNVMDPSPTGRWGERLSLGVRRALADDLGRDLPGFTVTMQPPVEGTAARQVLVDVDAFEPRTDGQVVLSVRWRLTDGGDRSLAGENASLTEQAANSGDAAVVAAMSQLVERLAQRIAQAVGRTEARVTPARSGPDRLAAGARSGAPSRPHRRGR